MTLEQAKALTWRDELHYCGKHPCTITIGPRGGYTERITRVRVSGRVQTWKRDASRVRVPVKHGLYESGEITEHNLADWHLARDCKANINYSIALEEAFTTETPIKDRTFTHKEV